MLDSQNLLSMILSDPVDCSQGAIGRLRCCGALLFSEDLAGFDAEFNIKALASPNLERI